MMWIVISDDTYSLQWAEIHLDGIPENVAVTHCVGNLMYSTLIFKKRPSSEVIYKSFVNLRILEASVWH